MDILEVKKQEFETKVHLSSFQEMNPVDAKTMHYEGFPMVLSEERRQNLLSLLKGKYFVVYFISHVLSHIVSVSNVK